MENKISAKRNTSLLSKTESKFLSSSVAEMKTWFTSEPTQLQSNYVIQKLWQFNEDIGVAETVHNLRQLVSDLTHEMCYAKEECQRENLLSKIVMLTRVKEFFNSLLQAPVLPAEEN